MDIEKVYKLWMLKAREDTNIIEELNQMYYNSNEKYERFYKNIKFGTAGLRGIMGAGTNRINIYTIRKATQGLANYLNNIYDNPSAAISFDSRINSELFAKETARVLAANGIKSFISKELQPTPVLSFAVRHLKCQAGVMITASHNPAEYNGYKCYGEDGCQMTEKHTSQVYNNINKIDIFDGINIMEFEEGLRNNLICFIEDDVYDSYIKCVLSQSINPEILKKREIRVTYTPLNGAGNKLVRKVLNKCGISNIDIVKEQEKPDGAFPTCKYPNPETSESLSLAIELASKSNSDIVIATDPDSDRIGAAVPYNKEFHVLNGNEIGILLFNYILSCRKNNNSLPENPIAIKTLVSSKMINRIARDYNCKIIDVLTGFKNIGEQILILEQSGRENRYVFGFEESHGYLSGSYVRDKDAVCASMLICEMCSYYKSLGLNLLDILHNLQTKYGFYISKNLNFEFQGAKGMEKMEFIMDKLREAPPASINGINLISLDDFLNSKSIFLSPYKEKTNNLPYSNMIIYNLSGGHNIIVRPSGTEPKIKIYIMTVQKNQDKANDISDKLIKSTKELIESYAKI